MNKHPVAIWSASVSFFATILAIGAIDILNPSDRLQFVSSVFVGLVTGGAVYARERLHDAKVAQAGEIVVTEQGGKKLFSLELSGDPDELEQQAEVIFKVTKRKP